LEVGPKRCFVERRRPPATLHGVVFDIFGARGHDVVTDVLSQKELEDIAANDKRVAGFQVEGLNAKPSIVQLASQALRA
jgi:hypothetical protein